VQVMD